MIRLYHILCALGALAFLAPGLGAGEIDPAGEACRRVMPVVGVHLNSEFPPKQNPDQKSNSKPSQSTEASSSPADSNVVATGPDGRDTLELSPAARRALKKEEKRRRIEILAQVGELLSDDFARLSDVEVIEKCLAYSVETQEMWNSRTAEEIADARRRDGRLKDAKALLLTIGIRIPD